MKIGTIGKNVMYQLTLFQPGGQIMPPTLLLPPTPIFGHYATSVSNYIFNIVYPCNLCSLSFKLDIASVVKTCLFSVYNVHDS